jgi:hypothetical protein
VLQLYRNSHYIDKFTIYGERHSGTNFLESCIKQQFELELTYFFGFKHWFGFTKPEIISYHSVARSTLFIGIVRNPYDWLCAMYLAPHHVPNHNRYNFYNLLTNEWYSVDSHNQEILYDRNYKTKQRYKNIFELRKEKCYYLSQIMPVIANNYVLLSYDSFLKNHFNYLNIIGRRFNLKNIGQPPSVIPKISAQFNHEQKNLIDSNLDWEIEESLGYFQK